MRLFSNKTYHTEITVETTVMAIAMLMQLYEGDTTKVTKFLYTENPKWFLQKPFDLLLDGKGTTVIEFLSELLGWE